MSGNPEFIRVAELARRFGRSKESIHQVARRGEIQGASLIGRVCRVNRDALVEMTTTSPFNGGDPTHSGALGLGFAG